MALAQKGSVSYVYRGPACDMFIAVGVWLIVCVRPSLRGVSVWRNSVCDKIVVFWESGEIASGRTCDKRCFGRDRPLVCCLSRHSDNTVGGTSDPAWPGLACPIRNGLVRAELFAMNIHKWAFNTSHVTRPDSQIQIVLVHTIASFQRTYESTF